MRQISSTHAKQSFGDLLKAAAEGPVAIEKHRKVQVIVASPAFFAKGDANETQALARRLARAEQAVVELDRLVKHQQIAIDLLTSPPGAFRRMIEGARAVVEQWRQQRLCSQDYIERWSAILSLPPKEIARAMTGDADGWGPALRQNSPWVRVRP